MGNNELHNQKYKYNASENQNIFFANDALMLQQGHNTRITFLDTKMPLPISSEYIADKGLLLEYNEEKYVNKVEKCEIIIPTDMLSQFIDNLEIMKKQYEQYKKNIGGN